MAGEALRLWLAADIGGLEAARLRLAAHLQAQAVEARTVAAFELVLEEALTNTLRYGYRDTGLRWIDLVVEVLPDDVLLTIEDDGVPFDPLAVPPPELPRSLEQARVGGLGLLMIRRSTRAMDYERVAGRNRLRLTIPRRRSAQIDPVR